MKIRFASFFKSPVRNVPESVKDVLMKYFPEAINIEWEARKNDYEAVFYLNDVEHIAKITGEGILLEYKRNLKVNELPEAIAEESRKNGEIMNGIAIFRNDEKYYEVIIRDAKFNRSVLLFNEDAELLHSKKF